MDLHSLRHIRIFPARVFVIFGTLSKHSVSFCSASVPSLSPRGDVSRRFLAPAAASVCNIRSTMKPWSDSKVYTRPICDIRCAQVLLYASLQKHCQLHCFGARACKIKVGRASFLHQTKGFCLFIERKRHELCTRAAVSKIVCVLSMENRFLMTKTKYRPHSKATKPAKLYYTLNCMKIAKNFWHWNKTQNLVLRH